MAFAPHAVPIAIATLLKVTILARPTAFARSTTFAGSTAAMFAWAMMLATVSTPAMMRRRPGGPHPLGIHPVHDAVKLFNNPIEAAGRVVACRGPFIGLPFLGCPRVMNPARDTAQHHHTPSHGQPFPRAIHRRFSWFTMARPPWSRRH
jgi:hypothetical protein